MSQNPPTDPPTSGIDALALNLVARGLPRADAERYAQELRDHEQDVVQELTEAGNLLEKARALALERLGPMDNIANAAVERFRQQTFVGRHAWLFFAILPPFILPMGVVAFMLAVSLPRDALHLWTDGIPPQWHGIVQAAMWTFAYGYPSLAGVLYDRAVRRRALGPGWRIAVGAMAVLWGAFLRYHLSFDTHQGHHGQFLVAFGPWPNVPQALAAATLIALFAHVGGRRSHESVTVTS